MSTPATVPPAVLRAMHEQTSACRREAGLLSPERFAKIYLADVFSRPSCSMHDELFKLLDEITEKRGSRLAIAAPRGHAKSTIASMAYVLWCLLARREPYILIVSSTKQQAQQLLTHVKEQLESNALLRDDFPELRALPRQAPWRTGAIRLPSDESGATAMVSAVSVNQNIRGLRHDQHRPSLIIADDLEDRVSAESQEKRDKLRAWFAGTLLKCGTPETNIVVIGNIVHHESLLARLVDRSQSTAWTSRVYRAVPTLETPVDDWMKWCAVHEGKEQFEGATGPKAALAMERHDPNTLRQGTVLWPALHTFKQLMLQRYKEGAASFEAELQNNPFPPDRCLFSTIALPYYGDRKHAGYMLADNDKVLTDDQKWWVEGGRCVVAWDPASGDSRDGLDFNAIVMLYVHSDGRMYVVEAIIERMPMSEALNAVIRLGLSRKNMHVVIEYSLGMHLAYDALCKHFDKQRIVKVVQRQSKTLRINSLEVLIAQKRLLFNPCHRLLIEQLKAFPLGKHDDGPDALEMAVRVATRLQNSERVCAIQSVFDRDIPFIATARA